MSLLVSVVWWFFSGSDSVQQTISTTSGTIAQGENVEVNNYFDGPNAIEDASPPLVPTPAPESLTIQQQERIYIPPELTPEELHRRYLADAPIPDLHIGHFVPSPGWKGVVARRPQQLSHQLSDKQTYMELKRNGQPSPVLSVYVAKPNTAFEIGNVVYVYGRIKDVRTHIVILDSAVVTPLDR